MQTVKDNLVLWQIYKSVNFCLSVQFVPSAKLLNTTQQKTTEQSSTCHSDPGSPANDAPQTIQRGEALIFAFIRSVVSWVHNILHQQRAVSQLLPPLIHYCAQQHAVFAPCDGGRSYHCIRLRLAIELQHTPSHCHRVLGLLDESEVHKTSKSRCGEGGGRRGGVWGYGSRREEEELEAQKHEITWETGNSHHHINWQESCKHTSSVYDQEVMQPYVQEQDVPYRLREKTNQIYSSTFYFLSQLILAPGPLSRLIRTFCVDIIILTKWHTIPSLQIKFTSITDTSVRLPLYFFYIQMNFHPFSIL